MDDFYTSDKGVWNKTSAELTVGDELKLAALHTTILVGVTAAFVGSVAAWESIAKRRNARKARKFAEKAEFYASK